MFSHLCWTHKYQCLYPIRQVQRGLLQMPLSIILPLVVIFVRTTVCVLCTCEQLSGLFFPSMPLHAYYLWAIQSLIVCCTNRNQSGSNYSVSYRNLIQLYLMHYIFPWEKPIMQTVRSVSKEWHVPKTHCVLYFMSRQPHQRFSVTISRMEYWWSWPNGNIINNNAESAHDLN